MRRNQAVHRPATVTVIVSSDQRRGHVYNGLPPVDWNECGSAAGVAWKEVQYNANVLPSHLCPGVLRSAATSATRSRAPMWRLRISEKFAKPHEIISSSCSYVSALLLSNNTVDFVQMCQSSVSRLLFYAQCSLVILLYFFLIAGLSFSRLEKT